MSTRATDTFTRADEAPLASPWTDIGLGTTMKLSTNAVTPTTLGNDAGAFQANVPGPPDQYSQCTVTMTGAGGNGEGPGPGVRMAAGGNAYALTLNHNATNNVQLTKIVGGGFTGLWQRTQAFTDGDLFALEIRGTTLIARYKGTPIGANTTDSALAAGSPGMFYSSVETAATIDNWEGGDFAQRYQPWTHRAPLLAM